MLEERYETTICNSDDYLYLPSVSILIFKMFGRFSMFDLSQDAIAVSFSRETIRQEINITLRKNKCKRTGQTLQDISSMTVPAHKTNKNTGGSHGKVHKETR